MGLMPEARPQPTPCPSGAGPYTEPGWSGPMLTGSLEGASGLAGRTPGGRWSGCRAWIEPGGQLDREMPEGQVAVRPDDGWLGQVQQAQDGQTDATGEPQHDQRAEAGGKNPSQLDAALKSAPEVVGGLLS